MASSGSGVSELPQDVFNFSICLLTISLQKSEGRIEFEAADLKAICTDFSISEQNLPRNISFSVQNIQLGFATDGSLPKLVLKRWCPVQILPLSSDPFVRLQLEGAVIDEKNCYSLDVSILPIICHIDGRFIRFTHQALSHIPSLTGTTTDISPSLVRSALVHAIRLKIYLEIESMDVQKLRCGDLKQLFSMFPLDGCELSLSEVLVHHSMMSNSQWISEIIRRWMGEVKATGPGRILGSIYQFKGLSEILKKTNDLLETITASDSSRLSYTIALSERSLALGHTVIVEMISMSQKSLLVTSRLLYAMASQRQGRLLRPGTMSNSEIEDCVQHSRRIIMREMRLAISTLNELTSESNVELDQDVSLIFQRLLEMVLRPVQG